MTAIPCKLVYRSFRGLTTFMGWGLEVTGNTVNYMAISGCYMGQTKAEALSALQTWNDERIAGNHPVLVLDANVL